MGFISRARTSNQVYTFRSPSLDNVHHVVMEGCKYRLLHCSLICSLCTRFCVWFRSCSCSGTHTATRTGCGSTTSCTTTPSEQQLACWPQYHEPVVSYPDLSSFGFAWGKDTGSAPRPKCPCMQHRLVCWSAAFCGVFCSVRFIQSPEFGLGSWVRVLFTSVSCGLKVAVTDLTLSHARRRAVSFVDS